MLNKSKDADDVAAWQKAQRPEDFGGEKTFTIHTNNTDEVSQKDLEAARKFIYQSATLGERMLFEGYDILTRERESGRHYTLPQVQSPQEVIAC